MKQIKLHVSSVWTSYLYGEWWKLMMPVLLVVTAFSAVRTNDVREGLSRLTDIQRGNGIQTFVLLDMLEAESGQRGYILTGDKKHFYAQYAGALGNLKRDRPGMNAYLLQHPAVKGYKAGINKSIDAKLAEMDAALQVYETKGRQAAADYIHEAKGYELMEEVRAQIAKVRYQQLEALQQTTDR